MSMCNNDVTYHDKWNTKENQKWQRKCDAYTMRALCMSDVPKAWAKEVYELLHHIDKEFGIRYVINFHYGMYTPFNIWSSLIAGPFSIWFTTPFMYKRGGGKFTKWEVVKAYTKHNLKKPWRFVQAYTSRASRSIFMLRGLLYNWWRNPKVGVSQIKEKYGYLTIYHSAPDWLDKHIDELIDDCEVKLAQKGAYYPLESLVGHTTSSSLPDNISISSRCFGKLEDVRLEITHHTGRSSLERAGVDWKKFPKGEEEPDEPSKYVFDFMPLVRAEYERRIAEGVYSKPDKGEVGYVEQGRADS